ncbi:peroxide stress protein YaaA [Microbacterium sediminicola]|uniref:Peroxide stress protein YaaA n=1 Tax=Microbacterium sediminicola TaxID=415210 RepID=A0ABP4TLH5_9MICO
MLILLPPSETKRVDEGGPTWDIEGLVFPELTALRERVVDALVTLSDDEEAAARALKLGKTQRADIGRNALLRSAPGMPAIDRYTGVLYDALEASSVDAPARSWLSDHVLIHSAPFGPVGALDAIPYYRLAAAGRLPGLPPLRSLWAEPVARSLADTSAGLVLDLRSEAYVALGAAPVDRGFYVRVVSHGADGVTRALNHFNKAAKGRFVRALAESHTAIDSLPDLLQWAAESGIELHESDAGELLLVV